MKTIVFVLLFSLISLCQGIVNNTIVIGMSISLTPSSSSRAQLGVRVNDGMTFYIETIDRTVVIDNTTYEIDIRTLDDQSNATLCVENYKKFMADPEVDFLLAPINSDWSQMIRAITEPAGRILLSATAASDSFYSGATYAFSILTPSKQLFTSTIPSLRFLGVKSIAYISETQPFTFAACNTLQGLSEDVGISMLGGNTAKPLIPAASYNLTDAQKQNISDALDLIQQLDPDYMIICAFPPNAFEIIRQAKARNYTPRGIFVTPMLIEWETFELNEYISGNEQWISTANYPADPYYGNSLDYTNNYKERFGYAPDGFSAMGSVSPLVFQEAIQAAKSIDQDTVQFALSRTALDLFFGTITYAVNNACLKEAIDMQVRNSTRVPVGPPRAQLASIIYPIPTWDERVYDPVWLDNPAEIVITVLTAIVMLFVFSLMIIVVYLRKHRVVKAASPVFLEFVLIGCLFLLSSNFAWTLHATNASCGVIPWLIGTGFVLMFGYTTFSRAFLMCQFIVRKDMENIQDFLFEFKNYYGSQTSYNK